VKLEDPISENWSDKSDQYYEESSASYHSPPKRGRAKARSSQTGSGKKKSKSKKAKEAANKETNATRGLRHFSLAVCNRVKDRGVTSYNEVADDLVQELAAEEGKSDEKNIRRRVYDALNVLSAMDIIRKVKKEIHWVGLPTNSSMEFIQLEQEHDGREERLRKKEEHLLELVNQFQLYTALIKRNAQHAIPMEEKLSLPFIIVSADNHTKIDLRVSSDRSEYVFDFTHPFEVKDDPEILMKVLGRENNPRLPNFTNHNTNNNNSNNNSNNNNI
jgi:hypothetical protein